ncbi:MAG: hypothetical protein JXQ75_07620 [Phycisphaerae bacterium]|nr:hypothetical protein [Phycisphaerae bacterium]
MKTDRFHARSDVPSAWLLAALAVATVFPLTAVAADRLVVCEEFTACGG